MQSSIHSIRRRNALVPLPLLPPVPCNTIVTSVRIVHNQSDSDNAPQFTSPFSSSPTNLCFAPVTGCGAKRVRSARRRSSCTPCQQPTVQKSNSVAVPNPNDNCDSSLLNPNRKPRSTIVVTVRLANPAPTNASFGSRSPHVISAPRAAAAVAAGVTGAFAAMQARKVAHKPRVSSPLASSVVTAGAPSGTCSPIYVDAATVRPRPVAPVIAESARRYVRKSKSNKGKNVGRVGMLRWAVLNHSGPEVGRRILAMGSKLAQEIWEAERVVENIEAVESNEMEVVEKKQDVEVSSSAGAGQTEEHNNNAREKLAEECIRELEEMEVDSEDIEMESSSSTLEATTNTTTEKATETPKSENNNNNDNMDVDMPAPVAVVTPLSTARQVQIQLEIAVEVFSSAKKAQKDAEKSKRWFERIAL